MTQLVVPLVGTWIETVNKYNRQKPIEVVPLVGTWIETSYISSPSSSSGCRSPRGNVD